ncbi:MAG: ATP-binding cassette domain-containing protein [Candidatus Methanoperedenaceae archaeon]|nr:ATP-binding cassette domain-containing protein [Candidatus Methanoperedenaceae archaeon]MDW7727923.1 ATP-binding cassette domain-containing protein [Candidatus Methanoperedens sp.]
MAALIEIRDLNISANGKQILKNINLDINEGDSIGIIGKSGAGKSIICPACKSGNIETARVEK